MSWYVMIILKSHSIFFHYSHWHMKQGVCYFCSDALGDGANSTSGIFSHAIWGLLRWCQDTENVSSHLWEKDCFLYFWSYIPSLTIEKRHFPWITGSHVQAAGEQHHTPPDILNIVICVVHKFRKGTWLGKWPHKNFKIWTTTPKKISVLNSLHFAESPATVWPH